MRKTLLLTLILLLCAAWAVGQQGARTQAVPGGQDPQTAPGANPAAQGSPTESTIEGCLGGSANAFTLTDKAGTSYQLQLPQSADNAKLSEHVGQEVRVTGTVADPASTGSAASPSAAGQSAAGASGSQPSIVVSKMHKVADTCTNAPTSPSK